MNESRHLGMPDDLAPLIDVVGRFQRPPSLYGPPDRPT
jgi:hypothetical protein